MQNLEEKYISKEELFTIYHDGIKFLMYYILEKKSIH